MQCDTLCDRETHKMLWKHKISANLDLRMVGLGQWGRLPKGGIDGGTVTPVY